MSIGVSKMIIPYLYGIFPASFYQYSFILSYFWLKTKAPPQNAKVFLACLTTIPVHLVNPPNVC